MAIICCWTTNPTTTKAYLFAVALADYGHIYAAYRGVGSEVFLDVGRWDEMTWANVGVSAFLNVCRWGTLMGVFGSLQIEGKEVKRV